MEDTSKQTTRYRKQSLRLQLSVALGTNFVYGLIFLPLYYVIGSSAFIGSLLPVAITGWLLGLRAGLLMISSNVILLFLVGAMDVALRTLLASVFTALMGFGFGILRDLRERLAEELFLRRESENILYQYTAELETRNQELDAFAHTVAHDLRGPLTPIIGIADLLAQEYNTMPDQMRGEFLSTLSRNARKLNSILDELLLLSEVRKADVKMEPLDMASVQAGALERIHDPVKQNRVEVIVPTFYPAALGYGPWIEEVWVNYLSNAIKYGGRPPRVELGGAAQADGTVRFWVRDNGDGISPEGQARLFVPFTRLAQARARGHGLRLSIVRRIMEKLGGEVGVESIVGQGSVFSFTLPARLNLD